MASPLQHPEFCLTSLLPSCWADHLNSAQPMTIISTYKPVSSYVRVALRIGTNTWQWNCVPQINEWCFEDPQSQISSRSFPAKCCPKRKTSQGLCLTVMLFHIFFILGSCCVSWEAWLTCKQCRQSSLDGRFFPELSLLHLPRTPHSRCSGCHTCVGNPRCKGTPHS